MSRYYKIVISRPSDGAVLVPNFKGKAGFTPCPRDVNLSTYTSLNPGALPSTIGGNNRAALRLECDLPITVQHEPIQSNGFLKISGVSLAEIGQASNLTGLNIAVYGGMSQGLPLAKPQQAGLLALGQIQRAYGNWIGNDQTLNIYLMDGGSSSSSNQTTGNPATSSTPPVPSTNSRPANIVFRWSQGQSLMDAIVQCLAVPFPQYAVSGAINPNLVWASGSDAVGYFETLHQFAAWVHQASTHMIGGSDPNRALYLGVTMTLAGNTVTVYDGSTPKTPKLLAFEDLIGQPSWLAGGAGFATVQAITAMRGDLMVGDYVSLPPLQGTVTSVAPPVFQQPSMFIVPSGISAGNVPPSNSAEASAFQGSYLVNQIRHVGDSRSPNGLAWITVLDLAQISTSTSGTQPVASLPSIYTPPPTLGF
jgi:hypothetical protein